MNEGNLALWAVRHLESLDELLTSNGNQRAPEGLQETRSKALRFVGRIREQNHSKRTQYAEIWEKGVRKG